MKRTFCLLVLAAIASNCQPQSSAEQATKKVADAPETTDTPGTETLLPSLFTAADTLTLPMRELLRRHDLSALLQGNTERRRGNPTLQGFFGPDHYRFAMVLNEVTRDPQHPDIYHVRGKCRYRKNIRPFSGTLTVRQVADLDAPYDFENFTPADSDSLPADTLEARYNRTRSLYNPYSLRARLQLTEQSAENSGSFDGEVVMNFYIGPRGKMDYVTAPLLNNEAPARGSAVLLRGSRRNLTTREVKQFVVSADVFAAAPDVYQDFGIGERGGKINPKYAKLGWNELWENDEWWADSPKPKLSL